MAEYAANFIYNPGRVHSTLDALSRVPVLNAIGNPQFLLEAVCQAQTTSADQEFLAFKSLVANPTSDFSVNQGLIVKLVQDNSPIVIPGDANQLKQTILTELHTSPIGGHLGYHKLLELVRACFWWPHLSSQVQKFCRQCFLYQQTKVVTQKPLGLLQPLAPPSCPLE